MFFGDSAHATAWQVNRIKCMHRMFLQIALNMMFLSGASGAGRAGDL